MKRAYQKDNTSESRIEVGSSQETHKHGDLHSEGSSEEKLKNLQKKRRSPIWQHYQVKIDDAKTESATCCYCNN